MAQNRPLERMIKGSITGTSSGSTVIGTTENGTERFYPIFALMELTNMSGLISVATISLGTNSSTYDNIIPATVLTNLNAVNKFLKLDITSATASVAANTAIRINISGVAVATTYTLKVTIIGYYL